ncbi:MAG: hypothetical protein PHW10_04960 [Candidatus Peribacteraceae bacterium]|nr:hypothetical protein [Candidatus Peribacteraceae bacterium]
MSFDGATVSHNVVEMDAARHGHFHDLFGHSSPDSTIRRMLLASIAWDNGNGKALPPGLYRDVLPLLTPEDWHGLYEDTSFMFQIPSSHTGARERNARTSFHLAWYLDQEAALTMDTVGYVGIHKHLPVDVADKVQDMLGFFQAGKPHRALKSLLQEENGGGGETVLVL